MSSNRNGGNRKKRVSLKEQDKSNSQNSHLGSDADDELDNDSSDDETNNSDLSFNIFKNSFQNINSFPNGTAPYSQSQLDNIASDDKEFSIKENHDYIDIDNNDSDDDLNPSRKRPGLKGRGGQNSLPDIVIYAYLSNSSSTTPNLALNVLNNVKENLTALQIKKDYYSPNGISVIAPHSGHKFTLNELLNTDNKPVTAARCTFQSNPNDDDEYQKIALTIMNMIENVISKGGPLNLKTTNVFAAKITALYVEELRKTDLEFDFNPPKGMSLDDPSHSKEVEKAKTIFGKINTEMKIETQLKTSNPPWYAAATKACEPKASLVSQSFCKFRKV